MDDLSGLSWSTPGSGPSKTTPTAASSNPSFYAPLRPTPSPLASGRNTPLSAQTSAGGATGKIQPPKPTQDSFSNLVNFGGAKSSANLSLRERQDQLEAERRRKEEERRKQAQAQYGDGQFFDTLGRSQAGTPRTSSPAIAPPSQASKALGAQNGSHTDSDADLFAAFNASTKVDNSSHFPPPNSSNRPSPAPTPALDLSNPQSWNKTGISSSGGGGLIDDDDDPFGLSQLKPKSVAAPVVAVDEDDFLGDLAKPVDQVRKQQPQPPAFSRTPEPGKAIEDSSSDSEPDPTAPSNDPFDKAVAQLVDYGFTPENARRGLTESGAGLNVQAAVNWLLDDAHRQAKEKSRGKQSSREPGTSGEDRAPSQSRNAPPSWMRDGEGARSRDSRSPASADGDFTKTAAAVGSSLLKTANSFWKQGQKKVQKAVSEFQQDGDPNQPKWMRSAQEHSSAPSGKARADVTDEAMMLEGGARPGRGPSSRESRPSSNTASRDQSPAFPSSRHPQSSAAPKWQQTSQSAPLDPRSRLNKLAAEEEHAQAYISPARRKKTTPQPPPETSAPPQPEPDLLFNPPPVPKPQATLPSRPSQPTPRQTPRQSPAPRPAPAARPQRPIPNVSAIALQSSTKHRLEGTAHFKRGDYAAAHASYSSSLSSIPQSHPLAILLLCNRALTALKTGEPRQAVEDADTAINLIGPIKGEGEQVDLQSGDGEKRDMRELYGKALTRKAEALEQMEKWGDAATVWQLCVESGHGGALAIAGRQRCQTALAPKPKPAARPPAARPAAQRPKPAASNQKSSEAVERLRAANKAAEDEGAEKFALVDKVDARVAAWRDGKRENLRALLSSMENVLWEGSGWKKVGLHELVLANKVKIIYMKAIGKTHPDKLPQDASTEVRMIAAIVFSTLNEAWDKFKAENNL
ncbi:hypothetical protein OQA88_6390 [Cercophora sp. LCS_1]